MPRELTEVEAWRWIAERIEKGEWKESGICAEIIELHYCYDEPLRISLWVKEVMQRRLKYHMAPVQFFINPGTNQQEGPWAFNRGDADVRILAAYFLALDAEDFPNAPYGQ